MANSPSVQTTMRSAMAIRKPALLPRLSATLPVLTTSGRRLPGRWCGSFLVTGREECPWATVRAQMGIIGKKSVPGADASTQRCAGEGELVFALNHCSATLPDRAEDVNGKMRG